MHQHSLRSILIGALVCASSVGCATSRPRHPYPQDPLLLYKKPIETQAAASVPETVAQAEPTPPAAPEFAVAAAGPVDTPSDIPALPPATTQIPEFRTAERSNGPVPTSPVGSNPNASVPATPAVRPKETINVVSTPAIRRQVPETFGHAPDHSWLQGILEKHYSGHWELRYCDPAREDKHGGKVVLVENPRLAQFKPGDLVLVEGEILPENGARSAWRHFPQYRVKEVWLAQAKAGS